VPYHGLRIIDFHAHFPTAKPMQYGSHVDYTSHPRGPEQAAVIRGWQEMYSEQWRIVWDWPEREKEKQSDEQIADRWAAEVEKYGLDRVVFVTGAGNDNLAYVIQRHPDKFIGFAHHDPFAQDAARELERAITQLGFRGYKVFAPALEKPIEDKAAWPVWEVAEQYDIPVLVHFGILFGGGGIAWHENINPLKLYDIAHAFPKVNFVIPHFGCGWVREALQLCWGCANVHIDTCGSNQWMRWAPEEWTFKRLFRKYLETIGPDRLIFGTDASWLPRGFTIRLLQDQLRACRELNVPPESIAKIFSGNAARLLKT
jgi:predicted TIM-barrel fold metal-dependent hydrolase